MTAHTFYRTKGSCQLRKPYFDFFFVCFFLLHFWGTDGNGKSPWIYLHIFTVNPILIKPIINISTGSKRILLGLQQLTFFFQWDWKFSDSDFVGQVGQLLISLSFLIISGKLKRKPACQCSSLCLFIFLFYWRGFIHIAKTLFVTLQSVDSWIFRHHHWLHPGETSSLAELITFKYDDCNKKVEKNLPAIVKSCYASKAV